MKNMLISIKDISKFRQPLMGLAIIGVLVSHWYRFQGIDSGLSYSISSLFCRLIFTEGFLFLSGFGLYFSFSKNNNLKDFYLRRIFKLWMPFIILSIPVYSFRLLVDDSYEIRDFFTQLTTIYFWINGNFYGMWYVSLSLALYLVFPFVYRFIFQTKTQFVLTTIYFLISLSITCMLLYILRSILPDYYRIIQIGCSKIPIFIIGMYYAYLCRDRRNNDRAFLLLTVCIGIIYLIASLFKADNYWVVTFCGLVQKLVFIPVVCLVFRIIEDKRIFKRMVSLVKYAGTYSLEIYILHLHVYLILSVTHNLHNLSAFMVATLSVSVGCFLCQPCHAFISKVLKRINNEKEALNY